MKFKTLFLSLVCLVLRGVNHCNAVESDFTIDIRPGVKECFHQTMKKDSTFEFEYQVIEGGDLDINFVIQAPSGAILLTEIRKQDAVHKFTADEEGDYKFCLDNTFSRFSNKIVFFEILTDDADPNWNFENFEDLELDDVVTRYEMKLEDFRGSFDRVKENLDRSERDQSLMRTHEARDRNIVESNFERVNWWSSIQLFVMISVSLVQVLLIRSLFEDRSKVGKILKMQT